MNKQLLITLATVMTCQLYTMENKLQLLHHLSNKYQSKITDIHAALIAIAHTKEVFHLLPNKDRVKFIQNVVTILNTDTKKEIELDVKDVLVSIHLITFNEEKKITISGINWMDKPTSCTLDFNDPKIANQWKSFSF
jgi:hypothetical protein